MTQEDIIMSSNEDGQSLNSIVQLLQKYIKMGVNISPYLSAIQSLDGQSPGEKYKQLNLIVNKIIVSQEQANDNPSSIDESQQIPPAMTPLVRIRVGSALKSTEAVLEALKSEDKTIVNQALRAEWFFHGSNTLVTADYFINNIMPHVSVRTRFRIIKVLSQSLIGTERKAEEFFNRFGSLYGSEEALPLLPACGESFIFDEILKHKIVLSHNMLLTLYRRYPSLVIRYLNLGNIKNEENKKERNIHSISLYNYTKFLPYLFKHHMRDFLQLEFRLDMLKLGTTVTKHFFKNAADLVIEKPSNFTNVWTWKVICKYLTRQQFEKMYANLFPQDATNFILRSMIDYLKYYPKEKRFDLLTRTYKLKYSKDLLSHAYISCNSLNILYDLIPIELFEKLFVNGFSAMGESSSTSVFTMIYCLQKYPKEKKYNFLKESFKAIHGKDLTDDINLLKSEELIMLMPPDEREVHVKRIIDMCEEKSDAYYNWYCYMPLKECFPIFKEKIQKSSDSTTRCEFIQKMLKSCKISKSKEDLLNVLRYYSIRHKNERIEVMTLVLSHIDKNYDLKDLERSHWQILLEILERIHIKNELPKITDKIIESFFNSALYHLLIQCKEEDEDMMDEQRKILINKLFNMIIDYNIESPTTKWPSFKDFPAVERYCFDKIFILLSEKYPNNHSIWQTIPGKNNKLNLLVDIFEAIQLFTIRIAKINDESKDIEEKLKSISILEYPWLMEATKEMFDWSKAFYPKQRQLKMLIKRHDPKFYKSIAVDVKDDQSIADIRSGAAWIKLKKNQKEVMTDWAEYLGECRARLKKNSKRGGLAARRFILTAKWCKDLPVKFVDRCLTEINVVGSMKILGILLEGETFGDLATNFVPEDSAMNITRADAKEYYTLIKSIPPAMNFANPPVTFDVIALFCKGDYAKLAIQAFTLTSQRVSRAKIISFAQNLINKPISVKKHGIRLLFQMANVDELQEFVMKAWAQEPHVSIRELLAQLVQQRLVDAPCDDNWKMVEISIAALTDKDEVPLQTFCNVKPIKNKYAYRYIKQILNKVEGFPDSDLNEADKIKYLCNILSSSAGVEKYLLEDEIFEILEKYYFDTNSLAISTATQMFAKKVFSYPFKDK